MDKVFKGGWNDRSALVYWVLLVRELLMWPRAAVLGSEVAATMYIGLSHCVVS